jgi:hypothetical protein
MTVIALGIDPATKSGWGIVREDGTILDYGDADTPEHRRAAVLEAAVAQVHIVALEYNTFGNTHTVRHLSIMQGRWLESVDELLPWAEQFVLTTATWRRVYNPPRWKGNQVQRRKEAKAWAVATAQSWPGGKKIRSHDAAEACLIARCGMLRAWERQTPQSQWFDSEPTLTGG